MKAGKQLERVQLQMAEWVRPVNTNNCFIWIGWFAIARELDLQGYLRLYGCEFVPQPVTSPYMDLFVVAPAMFAAFGRAPYAQLPPEDLDLLAADTALRSRYCKLAVTVILPPLRRLGLLIATKMYLNESLAAARLDPLLPGIGCTWASLVGSLSNLYFQMCVYLGQFVAGGAMGGGAVRPAAAGHARAALPPDVPQFGAAQGRGHEGAGAGRGLVRVTLGGGLAGFRKTRGGASRRREGGGDVSSTLYYIFSWR
jgi:hypothetical protein